MADSVRVRFAPSPTGPLHIGGVRTALYNYLFAKKNGGTFILRIEDTDQKRYVPGAEEYIKESLVWCGLEVQEGSEQGGEFGPYRQSERMGLYDQYAHQLVEAGYAYYAFDTAEDLEAMRERMKAQGVPSPSYNQITRQYMKNSLALPADEVEARLKAGEAHVIRLKMPRNEEVKVHDIIRGWVVFHSNQLDDKVIFKGDGMPTYHLANVVDDYLMKITHVIRGEEWLPSTPLHVLLYRYLGWEDSMPQFAHLPLILKPDGKGKLSKRDGDKGGFPVFPIDWKDEETGKEADGYRERGFWSEAFINMLAFLGWNPGTDQEIFTMDELVEAFSLERVGKSGARFDFEKAKWFNQQHIKRRDDAELAELFMPILKEKGIEIETSYAQDICRLLKERVEFIPDFWTYGQYFFSDPQEFDLKQLRKKWKDNSGEILSDLSAILKDTDWNESSIEEAVKGYMESKSLGFGQIFPHLRLALSGTLQGPPVFELMAVLGRKRVVSRLNAAIENFPSLAANPTSPNT